MTQSIGYAARSSLSRLKPMTFDRAEPGPDADEIEVLYCGVCHSDIHQTRNEWGNTVYPCMPGHEIVGRVARTGAGAPRHTVGDLVGVGCMIDSCGACEPCAHGEENYCEGPNCWLATYNGPMVPASKAPGGGNIYGQDNTFGGYADRIVVREAFVLSIPEELAPEVAAPILCAGVTTYSPMKHFGVKAGDLVGVLGFGGLDGVALKIAKAMGAEVTVFTRTEAKLAEATRLGIHGVLESDTTALAGTARRFDLILSTVPEKHDLNPFVKLLKRDGTLVVVGALEPLAAVDSSEVALHRRRAAGSLIDSLADTQEVLDLCATHGSGPQVEMIPIQAINDAYKAVIAGDVRFRYMIDMMSIAAERK